MAYGWDDTADTAELTVALTAGDLTAASKAALNVSVSVDSDAADVFADVTLDRKSWRAWSAAARTSLAPEFAGLPPLTALRLADYPNSDTQAYIDDLAKDPWAVAFGVLHMHQSAARTTMTPERLLTMVMWSVWWWKAWLPIVEQATTRDGWSSFDAGTFAFGVCARLVNVPGGLELAAGLADDWVQPWDQLELVVRALAEPPPEPDQIATPQ